MVEVSKEEIIKLAKISGLELKNEEVINFQDDITKILEYISQLDEVDVTGVGPTYQVTDLQNVWREDVVVDSPASTKDLLELAPESEDNSVKVPKVL